MDEVNIEAIAQANEKLSEMAKRKETILKTIEEQGKLSDELKKRIEQCWDATELEDIYLPYKPKRRTRAQIAREAGLSLWHSCSSSSVSAIRNRLPGSLWAIR